MDYVNYRKKLGISFDDKDKTKLFLTKMNNLLQRAFEENLTNYYEDDYFKFCYNIGYEFDSSTSDYDGAIEILSYADSVEEFLLDFIFFINTIPEENDEDDYYWGKKDYLGLLKECLTECRISYEVFEDDDGEFIFPQGAKELDDALVSEPLEWLKDYPNARKTYITALKQYSDGVYIRDIADNLRKALETFLQEFLNNSKNLETNKNEISKYLGSQNVDAGFSSFFQSIINAYKNINDKTVKHNDAVDEKLLEFLLYQTGVLIRMILSVKNAELKN